MAGEQTLEGQEITVRAVTDGELVAELRFITSFNESVKQEIKENGYLGEPFNRYTDIHNGFGGDFEAHVNTSAWIAWEKAKLARAQRANAAIQFDIVRVDNFSDGSNLTHTYIDVSWGEQPTSIGSRGDKVKVKGAFMCSEKTAEENAFV